MQNKGYRPLTSGVVTRKEYGLLVRVTDAKGTAFWKKQALSSDILTTQVCRRKIKCNGIQPCEFCFRAQEKCSYTSAYCRGRLPSISLALDSNASNNTIREEDESILDRNTSPQQPTLLPRQHSTGEDTIPLLQGQERLPRIEECPRYSPEPQQPEMEGQYIGPASGVSFLLRIQKRLRQAISVPQASSIFTFGDAPLQVPESDPSFCMMLPRADAQRLVDRYFDFAMPTYRFLHKPTIQSYFNEFYDTLGIMNGAQNVPAKVALLFMVFAQARVYMPDNDRPGPPDLR